MATLVLSTIGGLVGGPVGAAIGGLLGQAVDHDLLFRTPGREGPRLADLKLQTSSYGTSIPRLFGTMRIAGCVIWSTDLIESRATAHGGKGQPGTTTYSYSASFAVALSGRALTGVGRIWADGNLLRGAGGDWKSQLGAFRLHAGDEDQPVDPLIAAADGAVPAHRGIAYAVFEQLQLADFGNRIPSLTFEVTADPAPVGVGAIAAELGEGLVEDAGVALALDGFAADGDSVRSVLDTLAGAAGGWWQPGDEALALRDGGAPALTVADAGVSATDDGVPRRRQIAAIDGVPRTVTLAHYDPARDYQSGVQRARRPGAGAREQRIDLPAAIDAGTARTLAEAALLRAEALRVTRTIALGPEAAGIAPGSIVAIAGERGSWRVTEASLEAMVVTLALVPLHPAPAPLAASGGRVLAAPDVAIGTTLLVAAELPGLDDAPLTQPRVTVLAAGTGAGWRRAALLYSLDDGASWIEAGGTPAPATLGIVARPPGAGPATLFDAAATIEVTLAHEAMTLADADDDRLDAGANLALVGDELVQFGRAAPLGDRRWRLSRLLRGRRGTEAAIGTATADDRFALIERAAVAALDLPLAALGSRVRLMASGVGDADPVSATVTLGGASLRPPAPLALAPEPLPDGGVRLAWVRRSRLGWHWSDGGDAPLGEESEAYRITLGDGEDRRVDAPALALTAAEAARGPVAVRQIGTFAESFPGMIEA